MKLINADAIRDKVTEIANENFEISETYVVWLSGVHTVLSLMDEAETIEREKPEPAPKKKGGRKPAIDTGKLKALHKAGWTADEIAGELKCTTQTVRSYIRKFGLS